MRIRNHLLTPARNTQFYVSNTYLYDPWTSASYRNLVSNCREEMSVYKFSAVALIVLLCAVQVKDVIGLPKKAASHLDVSLLRKEVRLQSYFDDVGGRLSGPGKPCVCGPNSVGCTYSNDEKICTCKYDYVQAPNGTCIKPCRCQNLGACEKNVCECREGTYGDNCEFVKGCEGYGLGYKCGDPLIVYCALNYARGGIRCACKDPSLTYDTETRTCIECECGPDGSCSFDRGKKSCKCTRDFVVAEKGAELEGRCRPCSCGPNSNLCKFNSTGKFCNCHEGFAQRVSQCKECVCGPHATCSFEGYKKVCTCDKGYKMENGNCTACDCGPHGTCLYDDNFQKVCTCNKDALLFGDTCVECNCGLDGSCRLNSEGKKTCTCDKGFGDREGYCIACQCYYGDETVPCTFTGKVQNCQCPEGFEERDFYCKAKNSL